MAEERLSRRGQLRPIPGPASTAEFALNLGASGPREGSIGAAMCVTVTRTAHAVAEASILAGGLV